MTIHVFDCGTGGHVFELDDDGNPDSPAVQVALRQTRARLEGGCDSWDTLDGKRCRKPVRETRRS